MNGCNDILESAEAFSAASATVEHGSEVAPIRIWMVDDNAAVRGLLANILDEERGLVCERQFSSPVGVLEALSRETAPDIILLDIEMGEHNGLEALRPIKALAQDTHVLMLTTFAGPGSRERAFRDGASDFMLKSWPVEQITKHIRQAMEFGSVAGLLTAFLGQGRPIENPAEPKEIELVEKSSGLDRWLAHLRGWLKFSPS